MRISDWSSDVCSSDLSLRAPNGPFKDGQVINTILKDAFAATGVTPPGPYVGSHVLRHSLATNMVRNGASLAEIGDMLRHRSRASKMIYAKLDIDGLRSIAKQWPVAGEEQRTSLMNFHAISASGAAWDRRTYKLRVWNKG